MHINNYTNFLNENKLDRIEYYTNDDSDEGIMLDLPEKNWWNPLYIFLKNIFGDKLYLKAANSFMYMGTTRYFNIVDVYYYKHGVTRKTIVLDINGDPYGKELSKRTHNTVRLVPESISDTMKYVYKDIEKFYGINSDDKYFINYPEYRDSRDKKLTELGYNVITVNPNNKDDLDKLNKIIKKS